MRPRPRGPLRGWSLAILGALEPVLTTEQHERGVRAVEEFKAYLRDLIDRREREPSRDEGEILSKLTAGSALGPGDSSEERLSELELLHNCIFDPGWLGRRFGVRRSDIRHRQTPEP